MYRTSCDVDIYLMQTWETTNNLTSTLPGNYKGSGINLLNYDIASLEAFKSH